MSKNHNIKKYIVIVTMLLCLVIFITIRWIIPYMRIIKSSQSTENTTDSINDIQVAQVIGNKSIINKTDYNINSVNIIKNIENIPKNLLEQYKDINISNENITGEYSIVQINLNIKNNENNEKLYTPNSNRIYIYDNSICIMGYEPMLMLPYTYSPDNPQHFYLTLQSGQDSTITLYYVIEDKYLDNDIIYELNPYNINKDTLPANDDLSKYIVDYDLKVLAGMKTGEAGISNIINNKEVVQDNKTIINKSNNMVINGVKYSIDNYDITKNIYLNNAVNNSSFSEHIGNNFSNEYSYVEADINITNTTNSMVTIDLDTIYLNIMENKNSIIKYTKVFTKIDEEELTDNNITIETGDSCKISVYFAVSDNHFDEKLLQSGMEVITIVINPDNIRINGMEYNSDEQYFMYDIAGKRE